MSKNSESLLKKIHKMYQNYGIETSNMDEDELVRIIKSYKKNKDIDADLKESEKFKDKFAEDIL